MLAVQDWLVLPAVPAIAASGEPVRLLADSCPSTFSIEIGNERTRVPVRLIEISLQ